MPAPRFDPTINLGHILTFLGFLAAGFGAYTSVRAEMAVYKAQQETVQGQISTVQRQLETLSSVVIQNTRLEAEMQALRDRIDRSERTANGG